MEPPEKPDFPIIPTPALQHAAQACQLLDGDKAKGDWIACCSRRFAPLARRIVGDDDLALDALQTSWTKILQAANASLGGPAACPWIATIVANSARDVRRRRLHRGEVPLPQSGEMDSAQDPETLAQERQMLSLLREMIAMLPGVHRQVLELRVYQDLSAEETAARLRISRSNVNTRMNRAVKLLKRRIDARINKKKSDRNLGQSG